MNRVTTTTQQSQCADLWRAAFGIDDAWLQFFAEYVGWDEARGIEHQDEMAAALVVHDFAQSFGGRMLPCAGIGVVASAAHLRSRGYARRLMSEMLCEQHAKGIPVSALYPSTRTLYRKVGYESAGGIFRYTVPLHRIDVGRVSGDIRPIDVDRDHDRDLVESLYRAQTLDTPGWLERNRFLWRRVLYMREGSPRPGYFIEIDGNVCGCFFFHRERSGDDRNVETRDLVLRTPEAGRRFLSFMADQRSVNTNLVFWGGPNDPALMLLSEDCRKVEIDAYWMLRIIDVECALAVRGYAGCLETELHVEVYGDDVIDANNGTFVLHVRDGRAEVQRGGRGDVRVHVRGLASLFAGHLAPHELRLAGLLESNQSACSTAQAIFGGAQPWMADGF